VFLLLFLKTYRRNHGIGEERKKQSKKKDFGHIILKMKRESRAFRKCNYFYLSRETPC
jgi:hypothetical protein